MAFAPTLVEILRSAFVKRGFQLLTLADVTLLHADSGHAPHSSILSVVQLYSCTTVLLQLQGAFSESLIQSYYSCTAVGSYEDLNPAECGIRLADRSDLSGHG